MSLLANVGQTDKIIRIVGGAAALIISFLKLGGLSTTLGIIMSIVGAVLILTALFNFCPLYKLLGMATTAKGNNT